MSRIAEGTLRLNVEDSALDSHLQKLQSVKAAWRDLQQGADSLKDAIPASFGAALKELNSTLSGESSGFSRFAKGARALNDAIKNLPERVDALRTALQGLSAQLSTMTGATVKVGGALEKIAAVIKSDLSPSSLKKSTSAFESLGKGVGALQRNADRASISVDGLKQAFVEARAAGVPLGLAQAQVAERLDKTRRAAERAGISIKSLQQDFIRFGATSFIAYHWLKGVLESFSDAAQQVDLRNTLTLSMENFVDVMKEARAATAGTVSELEMMKSAALMSSFGLPMENFAEQMGMVQKMAIRTGQSTEYLMESLARGVSRQSVLILDNLGLQISLTQSYETYAATLGKAASALTDMEKKQAVMAEVMRQSANLTKEVDVAASKSAQLQAFQATLLDDIRSVGETVVTIVARAFQKSHQAASDLLQTVKLLRKEMVETGDDTVQMSMADYFMMTRPGAMNPMEAMIAQAQHATGIRREFVSLSREELDLLEKQARAEKARAAVSSEAYQTAAKLRKEGQAQLEAYSVFDPAINDKKRLDLLYKQGLERADQLKTMYETGLITKEIFETERKANADYVEKQALRIDKLAQSVKLEKILDDFAKNREQLKAVEESIQVQGLYRDELQKNIELATFQKMEAAAVKDQKRAIAALGEDIVFNEQQVRDLMIDHNALAHAAHSVALLQYHVSRAMHADAVASLDKQNNLIIRQQLSAQNMLEIQYAHDIAQKQLNEKINEYNKMRANSITYATGEMKFTDEQIHARGKEVEELQRKVASLKESAKYQELGLKAAHDVTMLSKEQRQQEAYLLAGKKNRFEVEQALVKAREVVIEYEKQIAEILKAQNLMRAAGLTFMVDVLEGRLDTAQGKMAEAAESAGRLYEDLKRFPMPSLGGGGGGREKIKKETEESIAVFKETVLNQAPTYDEVGRETANILFRAFRQETEMVFDKEGNLISSDVKKAFQRDLMGSFKTDDQTIWSSWETFSMRPRAALEELKKFSEEVMEFQKAAIEAGALTPAQDAYLNTLYNRLEAEKAITAERVKLLDEWSGHAMSVETALRNAFSFAGDAQFFGREMTNVLDNLTAGFAQYAEVLKQEELNTYDLFSAAMPMMRSAYQAFVKDRRQRAGIEAVMQAAAAWASWPNVPKVITHSTAALMYAGIAGGAIKLPSKTQSSAAREERPEQTKGPLHIHLYGDSIATEGERGRYLEQIMAEARAEGRV